MKLTGASVPASGGSLAFFIDPPRLYRGDFYDITRIQSGSILLAA